MAMTRKSVIRSLFWLVTILSIGFIAYSAAFLDYCAIRESVRGIRWHWFALAVLIAVLHLVLCGLLFSECVDAKQRGKILPVFLLSQAAKYVPGKVWSMVLQRALLDGGASSTGIISANIRIMSVLVYAQLLVLATVGWGLGLVNVLAIPVAALAVVASDSILVSLARRSGWSILSAWRGSRVVLRSLIYVFCSTVATVLAWMVFYALALDIGLSDSLQATVVSSASFLAGLMSALPAGFGTREAAFLLLGNTSIFSLDVTLLPALVVVSRVWLLATDVLVASLAGVWLYLFAGRECRRG